MVREDNSFVFGTEDDDDEAIVAAKGKELEGAWAETKQEVQKQMQLLASFGTAGGVADAAMVPLTSALLQDHIANLRTLIVRYEMIAQQYCTEEGVQAAMRTVQEWKDQIQALRMSSRNANLQAKRNIDQAEGAIFFRVDRMSTFAADSCSMNHIVLIRAFYAYETFLSGVSFSSDNLQADPLPKRK